ncbi:PREDICTED: cadherin EGF LAG seven-pass G-type receptor 3-like [Galeopterus variegatus]|uniref:Cadherin EGF LAG seven-pass G-type receptor 3-like n=1 Tax=Galeopterus variegatus TaxID=482537 RepID=A0ABM0Q036_GALVR|nr:PREDICTED: cadherin EGF LAG seven-pass G-type receptor 3-like [Galeopterus variegatus]
MGQVGQFQGRKLGGQHLKSHLPPPPIFPCGSDSEKPTERWQRLDSLPFSRRTRICPGIEWNFTGPYPSLRSPIGSCLSPASPAHWPLPPHSWDGQGLEQLFANESVPDHVGYAKVKITLINENDNRPIFSQPLYNVSLYENVTVGTSVLTVLVSPHCPAGPLSS